MKNTVERESHDYAGFLLITDGAVWCFKAVTY